VFFLGTVVVVNGIVQTENLQGDEYKERVKIMHWATVQWSELFMDAYNKYIRLRSFGGGKNFFVSFRLQVSTDIEYKNSNPEFRQVLKIPFVVSLINKR